jgi:hypothetical protein
MSRTAARTPAQRTGNADSDATINFMSSPLTQLHAPDQVIDLRDPATATTVSISESRLRQARLVALIALVMLNIADLITTRIFLSQGSLEGNPLAEVLLGRGAMPYCKAAVLLGLGWSSMRSKPKLGTTCAMFFVVGVYTTAIAVNLLTIRYG